jgi:hypothetical protein
VVADDAISEVDGTSSAIRVGSHEHDTGSMEMNDPQPATLALSTVTFSGSSLSKIGENDPVMVDISNFTTTKILDKRSSLGGIEYKCGLWVACGLGERGEEGTRPRHKLRKGT